MMKITGLAAGLVSGFFASGGALVAVVALGRRGLLPRLAQATAQSAMLAVSAVSVFAYLLKGDVPCASLFAAAGGALGGFLGARVRMPDSARKWAFRALAVWAGLRLIYG